MVSLFSETNFVVNSEKHIPNLHVEMKKQTERVQQPH